MDREAAPLPQTVFELRNRNHPLRIALEPDRSFPRFKNPLPLEQRQVEPQERFPTLISALNTGFSGENGRGLEKSFDKKHIRFTLIRCKRNTGVLLQNIASAKALPHTPKRVFFPSQYAEQHLGMGATHLFTQLT